MTLLKSLALAAAVCTAATTIANPHVAILTGYADPATCDNFQEAAAYNYFVGANPDGIVIKPGETDKIDASKVDVIWIHIDRLNVGKGNLPAEFSDEATIEALKKFVADGGNLYLSKHATQLISRIGRIDAAFEPGIYGDGDGGNGTDVWTVNAQIGYMNVEADPSQFYDHRDHAIYKDLRTNEDFACETFALEGTGDGTEMHREDHNCCWDLNAYAYTADGANTVEKFQNENNAVVLGTWGHVVDYAVAGIIEFNPAAEGNGRIIANGLAACEWSPRSGVNAFHDNLERLTANTLAYLSKEHPEDGIAVVATDAEARARYYNLQGISVSETNLVPGVYVVVRGEKVTKEVVK